MKLTINGRSYDVDAADSDPALWVIRDMIGLTGTKFGCGIGICGACTVHVDGAATRTCITPVSALADREVTTIEGLATLDDAGNEVLHPVQQAFIDEQVPQCSWCMSGQMMTAAAFLNDQPEPTEAEVVEAMSRNYCRCGCYVRIKAGILRAAAIAQEARA